MKWGQHVFSACIVECAYDQVRDPTGPVQAYKGAVGQGYQGPTRDDLPVEDG